MSRYAEALAAIEAELSTIWPGYRRVVRDVPNPDPNDPAPLHFVTLKGTPFTKGGMPVDPFSLGHVRRIKWLLKRYELLQRGLDTEVRIVDDQQRPGRCYVHVNHGKPQTEDGVPPPVSATATAGLLVNRAPDVARIALTLGLSLERVERALEARPDDADALSWVQQAYSDGVSA